jgi:hypothetical protein
MEDAPMLRRTIGAIGASLAILSLSASIALAGQPNAECGDEGAELEPPGFLTGGFEVAETRYAGEDDTASLAHANSEHAVSQYDVACVHFTASH